MGHLIFPKIVLSPIPTKFCHTLILGDEDFRLHKNILKPYTRKAVRQDAGKAVLNYRLSRIRRVTENSFELLNQIFRVFYTTININP